MTGSALASFFFATRPKTLVASFFPVSLGACLAYDSGANLDLMLVSLCLLFSLLIQIATNLSNDYFDHLRGADDDRSIAPRRFSQR